MWSVTKLMLIFRLKNAFMRMRLKHHQEEYNETEMYLKIYSKFQEFQVSS